MTRERMGSRLMVYNLKLGIYQLETVDQSRKISLY